MTVIERIVGQIRASFHGGAWHGPSVMEVLGDVDAPTAAARPIAGAHSIWTLAQHLAATQSIMLRRIRGEEAGLNDSDFWEDMPAPTGDNWRALLDRLLRQEADLEAAVAAFPASQLDDRLMKSRETTAYTSFHGIAQHNTYHAGQIALLKKSGRIVPLVPNVHKSYSDSGPIFANPLSRPQALTG
jgi:uncharacterized damage-inducible protein DinB